MTFWLWEATTAWILIVLVIGAVKKGEVGRAWWTFFIGWGIVTVTIAIIVLVPA